MMGGHLLLFPNAQRRRGVTNGVMMGQKGRVDGRSAFPVWGSDDDGWWAVNGCRCLSRDNDRPMRIGFRGRWGGGEANVDADGSCER